jgi:hypothetical protein
VLVNVTSVVPSVPINVTNPPFSHACAAVELPPDAAMAL